MKKVPIGTKILFLHKENRCGVEVIPERYPALARYHYYWNPGEVVAIRGDHAIIKSKYTHREYETPFYELKIWVGGKRNKQYLPYFEWTKR